MHVLVNPELTPLGRSRRTRLRGLPVDPRAARARAAPARVAFRGARPRRRAGRRRRRGLVRPGAAARGGSPRRHPVSDADDRPAPPGLHQRAAPAHGVAGSATETRDERGPGRAPRAQGPRAGGGAAARRLRRLEPADAGQRRRRCRPRSRRRRGGCSRRAGDSLLAWLDDWADRRHAGGRRGRGDSSGCRCAGASRCWSAPGSSC